jgi:hypothetical protein
MKRLQCFSAFCFAAMLTTMAGCASTPGQEGGGEYVDDGNAAAILSAYVFLHETRNTSILYQVPARANVCPE